MTSWPPSTSRTNEDGAKGLTRKQWSSLGEALAEQVFRGDIRA